MHPRIILRHKSPCSPLLGSHFSKASTTHKYDLVSAIFFHNPPTTSLFKNCFETFSDSGFCCCFCFIFQFIRYYIISTHRNLALSSLVIWIYAMDNCFLDYCIIAVPRPSPWTLFGIAADINCCSSQRTFLGIAVDINCCSLDLAMDIFFGIAVDINCCSSDLAMDIFFGITVDINCYFSDLRPAGF